MVTKYSSPVKKSALATYSGPGSVVRLSNGITAVVASLDDWDASICEDCRSEEERRETLEKLYIHEPYLEGICGVDGFVVMPTRRNGWSEDTAPTVSVYRFPLSQICSNWNCSRIFKAKETDTPHAKCPNPNCGFYGNQVDMFWICPNGHLEEIDWAEIAHHGKPCSSNAAIRRVTLNGPLGCKCLDCEAASGPTNYPIRKKCNGIRAWEADARPEECKEDMTLVERTNTQIYYPENLSVLRLPNKHGLRDDLMDWLIDRKSMLELSPEPGLLKERAERFLDELEDMSLDDFERHVKEALEPSDWDESWDETAVRRNEWDVLTGPRPQGRAARELLDFQDAVFPDDPDLFGGKGMFSRLVRIDRLSETRVLGGFQRLVETENGKGFSPQEGKNLLWSRNGRKDWLPAYRANGEGLLFVMNPVSVEKWRKTSGREASTYALAHTFAHIFLSAIAHHCGYPTASLCERLYVEEGMHYGFLIYTANSDHLGTLGGLVDLADSEALCEIMRRAIEEARWCPQDPVCIGSDRGGYGGACHHCCMLPETSCESRPRNSHLDRALLIGRGSTTGFVEYQSR